MCSKTFRLQLRQSVNDGLAANVRCADEVRAQKEMARGALAELEAEWAVRLERLRLEAKALEQQREETHDKLQVGATRRVASHLAWLHRACRTAYGVCCMLHLTVALGPTTTSRRCVALRCAFTWAAPNCGVLLPTAVLDWTRWHHRVHCGGLWSLQEELQLTSRLRKELAELRATGVGY